MSMLKQQLLKYLSLESTPKTDHKWVVGEGQNVPFCKYLVLHENGGIQNGS